MRPTDYRELSSIETVRPSIEDVDEMMKCRAYVRQVQILYGTLDGLYAALVRTTMPEADMHRIRGHIMAIEEVLGIPVRIAADIQMEARNAKPEGQERPDGEAVFRAALEQLKGIKHV